jgi:hypothetical protein
METDQRSVETTSRTHLFHANLSTLIIVTKQTKPGQAEDTGAGKIVFNYFHIFPGEFMWAFVFFSNRRLSQIATSKLVKFCTS